MSQSPGIREISMIILFSQEKLFSHIVTGEALLRKESQGREGGLRLRPSLKGVRKGCAAEEGICSGGTGRERRYP
ncbi:hypothetical protein MASR2M79_23020 [Aminivibrio sp.]